MNKRLKLTKKLIYVSALVFIVLFSVGYSALSTNLNVNGSTKYRSKMGIRITNVTLTGVTGGGVEQFSPSYTSTTVTLGTSFSSSGTVTYQVEITNYTDTEYNISYSVNTNNTYTITENYTNPVGEGVYTLDIVLSGTSGTDSSTVTVTYSVVSSSNKLYDVLKFAAQEGMYARRYTGLHQDSTDASLSTEDIYYWYATSDDNAEDILEMNNVVFGGYCWQMIRTTDTGGVRLLYNGPPETITNMNHEVIYNCGENRAGIISTIQTRRNMQGTYYYSSSYTVSVNNGVPTYTLLNPTQYTVSIVVGSTDISTIILNNPYTCFTNTTPSTCTTLTKLVSPDTSGLYAYVNQSTYRDSIGETKYSDLSGGLVELGSSDPTYESSISDVGYMYNNRKSSSLVFKNSKTLLSHTSISSSTWFADSYTYDSSTNQYTLNNKYHVTDPNDYPSLVGKYISTVGLGNFAYSIGYITSYYTTSSSNRVAYITISGGYDYSHYNDTFIYGDTYTDNLDGTYSINNPSSFTTTTWYQNMNNVNSGMYLCQNPTNNICSDLWLVTSKSIERINYYSSETNKYKFSNSYSYDSSTGLYTLTNSFEAWDYGNNSVVASLSNGHYTCKNLTGQCSSLYYVFYVDELDIYYILINNGNSLDDILNELLYDNSVNTNNSLIKTELSNWFNKKIGVSYRQYIEDTAYCNDRTIASYGGLSLTGSVSDKVFFKNYFNNTDLNCPNTDMFSVNNLIAHSTYNVGLPTKAELNLLNNSILRSTVRNYWLMSPTEYLNGEAYVGYVSESGSFESGKVSTSHSVRPVISLIPGIEYITGDGSTSNPYVLDDPSNTSTEESVVMSKVSLRTNYQQRLCSEDELQLIGDNQIYYCYDVPLGETFNMQIENSSSGSTLCYDVGLFSKSDYENGSWGTSQFNVGSSFIVDKQYHKISSATPSKTPTICLQALS